MQGTSGHGASAYEDWTGADVPDARPGSIHATSANARYALARFAAGEPLNQLHAAIDEVLDRFELVMGTTEWGSGVEIGAGSGYAAATLSRRPGVRSLIVVDQSREYVEEVMPRAFEASGAQLEKLVRVVGSFNDLRLEAGSLDFALAVGALHHSEDLPRTLAELRRVVRPGGHVLVVDRYQPDHLTDAELEAIRSLPVGDALSERYGFEPGRVVTRRELGEHELRLCEWKVRFLEAGFEPHPFIGVDFSGRRGYAALSVPWRVLLERVGDRAFLARCRWHLLGTQIPFDVRWLLRVAPGSPVNLLMVCRRRHRD